MNVTAEEIAQVAIVIKWLLCVYVCAAYICMYVSNNRKTFILSNVHILSTINMLENKKHNKIQSTEIIQSIFSNLNEIKAETNDRIKLERIHKFVDIKSMLSSF